MNRGLALVAAGVLGLLALEVGFLHWMQPLDNRLLDTMVRSHAVELAKENGLDRAAVRRLRGILDSSSSSD